MPLQKSITFIKHLRKSYQNFCQKYSLDISTRYLPVVGIIKKDNNPQPPKILDVGSGDLGITPYYPLPITGVDTHFSSVKSPLIKPVVIKDVNLPFEDGEFDYVISVDMLEHVSAKEREKSISEMLRVAKKKIIVVVPIGRKAESQDKKLHKLYEKIHGESYVFLDDHVKNGLPSLEEMINCFNNAANLHEKKLKISCYPILNLRVRYTYMRLFISKIPMVRALTNFFIFAVPFRKYLNFGECYRKVFTIDIETKYLD